jgi:hypothetical protein
MRISCAWAVTDPSTTASTRLAITRRLTDCPSSTQTENRPRCSAEAWPEVLTAYQRSATLAEVVPVQVISEEYTP